MFDPILQIKSYIADRGGLYFKDHDLRNLNDAIASRMKSCQISSTSVYYTYLTTSNQKDDEIRELFNLLTVNHTYFFRDEGQFKILKEKVLPEIIRKKLEQAALKGEKPSLRVWSAGCSTGEEPYTIAIVLRQIIPDIQNWDIFILATDVSENALASARRGIYSEASVKHIDKLCLEQYFTQTQGHASESLKGQYAISSQIKEMVTYAFFNLVSEDYPSGFDLIFCRNVVIYFELGTSLKVMSRLHDSLLDEGYLFIGYSESLQYLQDKFTMLIDQDAIYYCKSTAAPVPVFTQSEEELGIDEALEEISRKQAVADLEAELKKAPAIKNIEEIMVEAIKLSHLKEYRPALELIREAHQINKLALDPYYLAAEILINQGRFTDAEAELSEALKINPMFAAALYLQGCVYLEIEDDEKAKANFKKALYLDSNLILAHFYLAQVFKKDGQSDHALREYRNTTKLLSERAAQDIIPYSGGFNAVTLLSVCRDNIERLKFEV